MTDIRVIEFNYGLDLDHYLNPIALIMCYFVVAITSSVLLGPQVNTCVCLNLMQSVPIEDKRKKYFYDAFI